MTAVNETIELPGTKTAPRLARAALTAAAADSVPREALGRMLLMTSEIVTNAFLHGGSDEQKPMRLKIDVSVRRAKIAVTDAGSDLRPEVLPRDAHRTSGFGLFLVEQLSDRWGVLGEHSTTVFFEVDLPQPA